VSTVGFYAHFYKTWDPDKEISRHELNF
jgi:hypothetical protein